MKRVLSNTALCQNKKVIIKLQEDFCSIDTRDLESIGLSVRFRWRSRTAESVVELGIFSRN